MTGQRDGDQPVNDYIKISRDKFIQLMVYVKVGGLVVAAVAIGFGAGILPWETSKHHDKQMENVWKLMNRVTVLEQKHHHRGH